jgi:hypothetical protein
MALCFSDCQALVFDLGAAVHDNFDPERPRPRRRRIVADAELHPDHLRFWLERKRLMTTPPAAAELRKMSTMSIGPGSSASVLKNAVP